MGQVHSAIGEGNSEEHHFMFARSYTDQTIEFVEELRQLPHHQALTIVFQRFASALIAS